MTSAPFKTSPRKSPQATERDLLKRCHDEPEVFFRHILGANPYGKQVEMLNAVRDHNRVAILGCNSSGKDWAAGRLLLWWLSTRWPAKALVYGPTHRQVDQIVWREARDAYASARIPLGGQMFPKAPRIDYDDQHFALGFSTDAPLAIQGFHSPHLLVLITEAHSVEQVYVDAIRRLNPQKIVMTGNPLSVDGEFHAAWHESSDLWHTVQISAFDTPLDDPRPGMVTREIIEERRLEWGDDSLLYKASILGEWPTEGLEGQLVTLADAREAVERTHEPDRETILGCDVARFGGDASVIYARRGPVARQVYRKTGVSTMGLVAAIQDAIESCAPVSEVIVDSVGVGGGVVDRLRELDLGDIRVSAFVGGSQARDKKKFFNAISEVWWGMAEAFRKGNIDIEDDKRLIAQITSRTYHVQSDRAIRLESKDDIKKRGGRSPDEADALALTYYVSRKQQMEAWTV